MFFLSVLGHHPQPGDPRLLQWIVHQIDTLLGFGANTIVAGLGLVIVAIPVAILAVYFNDRLRNRGP